MIQKQLNNLNTYKKSGDPQIDILIQKQMQRKLEYNAKYLITTLILLSSVYEYMANVEKYKETIILINWIVRTFLNYCPEMKYLSNSLTLHLNETYGEYLLETGEANKVIQKVFKEEKDNIMNKLKNIDIDDEGEGEGFSARSGYQKKLNNFFYDKYKHKSLNTIQCIFIKNNVKDKQIKMDGKKQILKEGQRDSVFLNQEMSSQLNFFENDQSTALLSKKGSLINCNTEEDQINSQIRSQNKDIHYFLHSFEQPQVLNNQTQQSDYINVEDSIQNTQTNLKDSNQKYQRRSILQSSSSQKKQKFQESEQILIKPKLLQKSRYFPETVSSKTERQNFYTQVQNQSAIKEKESDIYQLFSLKQPQNQKPSTVKDLDHFTGKLISEQIAKAEPFESIGKVTEKCQKEQHEGNFDKKEFGHCRKIIDMKRIYGNGTTLENGSQKNTKDILILDSKHKLEQEVKIEAYLHSNHIEAEKQIEDAKEYQQEMIKERQYQLYIRQQPKSMQGTVMKHSKDLGLTNLRQQYDHEQRKRLLNRKQSSSSVNDKKTHFSQVSFNENQTHISYQDENESQKDMKQILQMNEKFIRNQIDIAQKQANVTVLQMKNQAKKEIKEQSNLPDHDPKPKIPSHIVPIEINQVAENTKKQAKYYYNRMTDKHNSLANSTQHIHIMSEAKYATNLSDVFSIKMKINKIEQAKKKGLNLNKVLKNSILANLSTITQSQRFTKNSLLTQQY